MRKTLATACCALFMMALLSGPILAEESQFKITDYIPEKFKDFEWQIGGSAGLSGDDIDNEQYEPWGDLLYRHSHSEENDWRTRFNSSLSYDYETVPQFLNFDMLVSANLSSSESESSVSADGASYPGAGEFSYSKSDSWNHEISMRPSIDAGKYLIRDLFVSGIVSGNFMYYESPDGESYSRSNTRSFNDPYFREDTREVDADRSSDTRQYGLTLGFLPGWGRIYEGVYASTAMYMIEKLRKNGLLIREPDKDEMLKLSDLIYQNRLKHAIDDRLRRIETFDEILGYLEDVGITDTKSNRGYLYIQDVWDYFPDDRRQFGWRGRVGLTVEHRLNRRRYSDDSHEERLTIEYDPDIPDVIDTVFDISADRFSYYNYEEETNNVYAEAKLEYGYPLARQWQLSFDGTARFSLDGDRSERRNRVREDSGGGVSIRSDEQIWDTDNSYDITLGSTLSYIYSSRTRLDFNATYRYLREKTEITRYNDDGDLISSFSDDRGDIDLYLKTILTYRLSIPTTLSVTAGYYYDSPATSRHAYVDNGFAAASGEDTSNSHRYSLSVSLSHYLY